MEIKSEVQQSKFKRICVFCGSSQGKKSSYQDAAIELGNELVFNDFTFFMCFFFPFGFFAYCCGFLLLTNVFETFLYEMGFCLKCIGNFLNFIVSPFAIVGKIRLFCSYSQDAHASRGGYGTLEELLEVITWAQLGIHDKPVGLLNVDGYYNSLLSFIDKAVEEGFISPSARQIIVSAPTAKELVKKLEEYVPCHERVASKLSWEMEQLGYPQPYDISR
ncbi:hypothetical protein JRO89_XS12G0028600 [Xanthoceras sorbifolium]|uniref:cytokinin riboside 5'-monophosphate phosphoribohydrolase n=1 Tax=Xanthoceras sorbifolium TaxID=99658 RepID=A0ABQ8HAR8_9ROSI|nr:hypothetical protein JRO89_XS12G0028600 [Xanthoceras sorbifolium]